MNYKSDYVKNAPAPWVNLVTKEYDGVTTVNLWGRKYVCGKSALFDEIESNGTSILSEPMRICGVENGENFVINDAKTFVMEANGGQTVICATTRTGSFIYNTAITVAYDGYAKVDLKVVPVGKTVKEVFGLEQKKNNGYNLEKLWVEVALPDDIAQNLHHWPTHWRIQSARYDQDPIEFSSVCMSRKLTQNNVKIGFKPLVFLGNRDVGLNYFAESDEGWQYDNDDAIEVLRDGDKVILRLHLLDSHPKSWVNYPENPGYTPIYGYLPKTFSFAFQATPCKPFPDNPYKEKAVHIDCFKKIEGDYYEFLLKKSDFEGYKCNLDKIKAEGVTMLYLHEKWNKLQNFWQIAQSDKPKFKEIIEECHLRGIKVLPYFGYEISTLNPLWGEFGDEVMERKPGRHENMFGWYRQPEQRAYVVCYASRWADMMLDGIAKLFDEFAFDGLYLDSTLYPTICYAHGCGYVDKDGNRHVTYPVGAVRYFMERLYAYMKPRGKIISAHVSNCINASAMAYCDYIWDGEAIQQYLHEEGVDAVPMDYMRAEYVWKALGVPYEFLIYTFDNWTYEDGLSLSLTHGMLPKPNDIAKPLEITSRLWKIYDAFPIANSKFVPYWENEGKVEVSNSKLLCSFYEYVDYHGVRKWLMILSNPSSSSVDATVKMERPMRVNDELEYKKVANGASFDISLKSCQTKILLCDEIVE